MNELAVSAGPTTTLETLLTEMLVYGKPRLMRMDSGWHACLAMNTNAQGATFDIRSDYDMKTPLAAATQCFVRAIAAVKTIKER